MTMRYYLGQTATINHTYTQSEFDRFAALSGDDNPIHVDSDFAARTRFGKPVAHGMLLYSTISRLLGSRLPGPGSLQIRQALIFPAPTFVDEEVSVSVEVLRISSSHPDLRGAAESRIINSPGRYLELNTTITKSDGSPACQGTTWVVTPGAGLSLLSHVRSYQSAAYASESDYSGPTEMMNLALGQSAQTTTTFTQEDLREYVDLTGDTNPIHSESDYAKKSGFQGPVIPGGLLGGLFSCLLGTRLPGRGTNWLKQSFNFLAPAYPGEEITAAVEVTRLRPEKELVNLRTTCTKATGEVVCTGQALVLASDLEL